MLQVVGQVTARQLDGAAIGAGNHIEGAGGEVALRETQRQRGIRITHTPALVGRLVRPPPDNCRRQGEGGRQQVPGGEVRVFKNMEGKKMKGK